MTKAVLFDLDGTLWDSSEQVAASWSEVLKNSYPDIPVQPTGEMLRSVMGKTLPDIGRTLFPMVSELRAAEAINDCCAGEQEYLLKHGAPLYEGITEMLSDLSQHYALCIVSNCQEGYIKVFLRSHPELLPYISDTENAGRTGLPKWDNIRLICMRNGYQSAVYVGDTVWDYEAAKRADVPFVHAAYGFGTVADVSAAAAPAEIPAHVRGLLK